MIFKVYPKKLEEDIDSLRSALEEADKPMTAEDLKSYFKKMLEYKPPGPPVAYVTQETYDMLFEGVGKLESVDE